MAYGTIASEVVTHRILLQRCCSLNMEYTMGQPLKRPFHNNLEKCTVVNPEVNAARIERGQRPKLFRDDQGRMVRQHDAACPNTDRGGATGHMTDDHGCGSAGD